MEPGRRDERANPYVGPRPFRLRESFFYGRDREVGILSDMLIAERIVLLHSPSGAGKTSLIQAKLIPRLEERFRVLPILRVNQSLATSALQGVRVGNRFVLSALLSMEEVLDQAERLELPRLASMELDEYLWKRSDVLDQALARLADKSLDDYVYRRKASPDRVAGGDGRPARPRKPQLLIFDQFEEILTLNPADRAEKGRFFEAVGRSLWHDPRPPGSDEVSEPAQPLWALFAIRDDHVGELRPYVPSIPTRFATTFRLELLDAGRAEEAIRKPAASKGVTFEESAAKQLVVNLGGSKAQSPDGGDEVMTIEPILLQVVCYRLWEEWRRRRPDADTITDKDIESISVDNALSDYYDQGIRSVAEGEDVHAGERTIRDWFEQELITEQKTRGLVPIGPKSAGSLDASAVLPLIDTYLVREEKRRGSSWLELSHDRLIEPIKASNAEWRKQSLSPLQLQAALWESQHRSDDLLVRDELLIQMEDWTRAHAGDLTTTEDDYLKACQSARARAEKEATFNWWARVVAGVLAGLFTILIFLSGYVLIQSIRLHKANEDLEEQIRTNKKQEALIAELRRSGFDKVAQRQIADTAGPSTSVVAQAPALGSRSGDGNSATDLGPTPLPRVKWPVGSTLHIRYLDGDPVVQHKVEQHAQEWTRYANLIFDFGRDPKAEIRISFREQGSWSFLGTDAPRIPQDQPTMNYGWLTPNTPDEEYKKVVLHYFGHLFGLYREHQSPVADIKWNEPLVYRYFSSSQGWTVQLINRNVIWKYDKIGSLYHPFDPTSIMMFSFPKELTLDGFSSGINSNLSPIDKAFVGQVYPFPPAAELTIDGPAREVPLERLKLDLNQA